MTFLLPTYSPTKLSVNLSQKFLVIDTAWDFYFSTLILCLLEHQRNMTEELEDVIHEVAEHARIGPSKLQYLLSFFLRGAKSL